MPAKRKPRTGRGAAKSRKPARNAQSGRKRARASTRRADPAVAKVQKVSPSRPEARDEGPRLIPLPPAKPEQLPSLQHIMSLADTAIDGPKRTKPRQK